MGRRAVWAALAALVVLTAGERQARADALYAWGDNGNSQLGSGTGVDSSSVPVTVVNGSSVPLTSITAASAGQNEGLAVTTSGAVYSWGSGYPGDGTSGAINNNAVPVTGLSGVTVSSVAAGTNSFLALTTSGAVYAWGTNNVGQLGDSTGTTRTTAVAVQGLGGLTVSSIAIGTATSYALSTTGQVYAWGQGSGGELGNGGTANSSTAGHISSLSGIAAIAAGYHDAFAVTSGGQLYAWGYNSSGQLGNGSTTNSSTPVLISGLSGVKSVAAGVNSTLALTTSGQVYAWGNNGQGQLGNGTSNIGGSTPSLVSGLSNIVEVAAGSNDSFALSANGTLYAWGYNDMGQLGDGSLNNQLTPEVIAPPTGYHFTSISSNSNGDWTLATLAPTAVPGPASLLSCLLGLPGVLALRRRLRNRA